MRCHVTPFVMLVLWTSIVYKDFVESRIVGIHSATYHCRLRLATYLYCYLSLHTRVRLECTQFKIHLGYLVIVGFMRAVRFVHAPGGRRERTMPDKKDCPPPKPEPKKSDFLGDLVDVGISEILPPTNKKK